MNWYINRTADIANGDRAASRNAAIMPLAYPGDGNAHVWRVTVTDSGTPASLTGAVPIGYFMRGYDGETVMQTGTVSGNVISVTIPAEAYAYPGHVTAIIRLNHGGANMTIDAIAYEIGPNVTGDIIDPGEVIPGIDDLIAQIERMEADTEAAEAAVAQVNDKLADFDVAIETFYPHSGGVGNIVTVEGTVDAPPAELIIYGKSVQSGTPTPSAPVNIVTAGSGGTLAMVSAGKNLAYMTRGSINYATGQEEASDQATRTGYIPVMGPRLYCTKSTAFASGSAYSLNARCYAADFSYIGTVRLMDGEVLESYVTVQYNETLKNAAYIRFVQFYPDSTTTPEIINLMIAFGDTSSVSYPEYVKASGITSAIPTPNGLPGIPVASGGNYTDTGETQWICDTIDLETGTWTKRVQRVTADSFARVNSQEVGSTGYTRYIFDNGNAFPDVSASNVHALCTHFPMISSNAGETGFWVYRESNGYPMFCFHFPTGTFDSNAAALAYMKALSGFELYYPIAAPVVEQLTAAQLTALRSLRGRKGQTNLYSTDPAGPEISAELYIDIPTYIQSLLSQMDRGFNVAAVSNGLEFTSIE